MNSAASQKHRDGLLERKRELEAQLRPLRELEAELHEVNQLLATYDRVCRGPERGGPDDR